MKLRPVYVAAATCMLVIVVFLLADHMPKAFSYALLPGSFLALTINGSLHDRVMPGFSIIATAFNGVIYSAVALLATKKPWK
ncbi:MAG: hypothetical protein LAO31_15415 [Acidobacteriia bacterium]|nr:hypothetical protein [Terriglobia bacterium]